MSPATRLCFAVRRDDWSRGRFERASLAPLDPGRVRLRLDRFALTSNNITYAAAGDLLDYWGFFPAEEGWGHIPVMGYADVVESSHPEVAVGERVFGFFPMTSELVVQAEPAGAGQFVDAAPHRRKHAPAYRQYARVTHDPHYDPQGEDRILLLRGLFLTSFLVDAFLADRQGFGAEQTLVGSASSKTGIALAWLLHEGGRGPVVGVTSPRHRGFVEGLGCYDRVIGYDEAKRLAPDVPTAFVDHSGRGDFTADLHRHLGERLVHHCVVGATHWGAAPRPPDLPGPQPAFFFAPGEIARRVEAWGAAAFQQRLGEGWGRFCAWSEGWLRVVHGRGPDDLARVYRELLAGRARPDEGHVLSLQEPDGTDA